MQDKISLLIGSCDSYSHLWKSFDSLLRKYWKIDCHKIFVGETIPIPYKGYENVLPGAAAWGARMLAGLERVKTPYVMLLLEDYFFSEPFGEERLNYGFEMMQKYQADKFCWDTAHPDYRLENLEGNIFKLKSDSMYFTSCQPSIWKTDFLKTCFLPEYSPWCFELSGTERISKESPVVVMEQLEKRFYFNAVRRGLQPSPGLNEFKKKEKLWN